MGVVCDIMSDNAADEEKSIGWMFPSSGGVRAKIANEDAHDSKKGSIARAQEEIDSSLVFAFAFAYLRHSIPYYT